MLESYSVPGLIFLVIGIAFFSVMLSRVVRQKGPPWLKVIMFLAIGFFAAFFITSTTLEVITPLISDADAGEVFVLEIHGRDHYLTAGMLQLHTVLERMFIGSWVVAFIAGASNELRKKFAKNR